MMPKSKYDLIMEEFELNGKVHIFTDDENSAIVNRINENINEFLYEQKINEIKSEQELKNIILID